MRADDRSTARLLSQAARREQSRRDLKSAAYDYPEKAFHIEHGLSDYAPAKRTRTTRLRTVFIPLFLVMSALFRVAFLLLGSTDTPLSFLQPSAPDTSGVCPQAPPTTPSVHIELLKEIEGDFESKEYRAKAYESLSGAIRIPTEMYDDLKPPGEDPHWEIFGVLHTYLETRFPLLHTSLRKTLVNSYALVYHWQGSDESLKPILLTAHQDVVPVVPDTVGSWKNPPFSGHYDGEWIWGRGSCDDKSGLISSLIAIETLLQKGFKPSRSIVLAYGIDEERGGVTGATALRDFLLATYGENAFAILVDEGGHQEIGEHTIIAAPGVAEKGSFNLRMEVTAPGGHSSVPPAHTSIGMLAALITELEAHPHVPHIYRNDTYYEELQCRAAHDPDFPTSLRKLVKQSRSSDKALAKLTKQLIKIDPKVKAVAGTTQAVDVIQGGVKTNALPESAHVIVNHRIAGYSSVAALKERIINVLVPTARSLNLSIDAFGRPIGEPNSHLRSAGHLSLRDAFGTALEPAPITATSGNPAYELLSGVIRSVLTTSTREVYAERKIILAPSILLGNTDTKHYWKLTKQIFRYSHLSNQDAYNGAHTVNEAVRAEGYFEMIRFFTRFILAADESNMLD